MGELSATLDEFSRISKDFHAKVMKILEDKYCWKCPMRSTNNKTNCREVDAWRRLTSAFEIGIRNHLVSKDISSEEIETITLKYLSKILKKHDQAINYDKTVILKLKEDIKPFASKGDLLFIKENPTSVKEDDLVLWPQICPVSIYWFSRAKLTGQIPFKIIKIKNQFQKERCRYIQADNGLEIPLEYLAGKVIKIIGKDDNLYSALKI